MSLSPPSSIRPAIRAMAAYQPGEQPRDGEYVKLNTNENPYPPSPRVFEAIQQTLTGDRLRKYPDPQGRAFRETAARILDVDPDSVLIGNGSDDVLTILTRAFVPEGGVVVSPTPSYLLYKTLAEIQGARYQMIPFAPDWRLAKLEPADLTFIANPNSPTGTVIPSGDFAEAAGPLVIDEAYVDFAEADCLHLARTMPNVIVTRSFSKSYSLAGIRFGFAVGAPAIIRELYKVKDSYNCDVLSLAAAQAALDDQHHMQANRAKIIAARTRMTAALRSLGFEVLDSQANFVWCQRRDRPAKPIYEDLKRQKILVRYMNYAGYGEGLRISVGTDTEVDQLLAALAPVV